VHILFLNYVGWYDAAWHGIW